ncbi:MAG: hypothetical protein DRQ62_02450 [Gammaproteobacteria bacterium]|nr:MAG: hypothetical protein DRQ62_02450 [Gammaproteobacteria bacterium]
MKYKKAFSSIASTVAAVTFVAALSGCASSPQKDAGDQKLLQNEVDVALTRFYAEATNARQIIQNAQGVLVCPTITKAGFVFGGEGGTCAMQINGATKEYYRAAAFKAGLIAGAEKYSLLLVFNDVNALAEFREGIRNWQVGGNLSASVGKKGAQGGFDTKTMGATTTIFVYSQKGLMGDISVDGSTFKKLVD